MSDCINRFHYEVSGADFSRAGEASADLKKQLKELGFDSETVRRTTIAVYEGEINMVIHGGGGVIDVWAKPEEIRMVLTDQRDGIKNIEEAMRAGFSTATEFVRDLGFGAGMGLPNMKQYSDELLVESEPGKGTRVTMRVFPERTTPK